MMIHFETILLLTLLLLLIKDYFIFFPLSFNKCFIRISVDLDYLKLLIVSSII
jgi:hypothetical protein